MRLRFVARERASFPVRTLLLSHKYARHIGPLGP